MLNTFSTKSCDFDIISRDPYDRCISGAKEKGTIDAVDICRTLFFFASTQESNALPWKLVDFTTQDLADGNNVDAFDFNFVKVELYRTLELFWDL